MKRLKRKMSKNKITLINSKYRISFCFSLSLSDGYVFNIFSFYSKKMPFLYYTEKKVKSIIKLHFYNLLIGRFSCQLSENLLKVYPEEIINTNEGVLIVLALLIFYTQNIFTLCRLRALCSEAKRGMLGSKSSDIFVFGISEENLKK